MSKRLDRRIAYLKHNALQKQALTFDLDPELDYARPENSDPERAFHLLQCGFDLLTEIAHSGFPSLKRRGRKQGSKWVRETLLWRGTETSRFLAHVTPTLLAATGGRLTDDGEDVAEAVADPDHHLMLERSVSKFFPRELWLKPPKMEGGKSRQLYPPDIIDKCCAEFEVLEKRTPREEVASGEQPANEYSLALMRGEEPEDDSELAELQRRYARDYFIHRASVAAIDRALRPPDFNRLGGKLIPFLDPTNRKLSKYRARALGAWVEGTKSYRKYALIEFQNAPAAVSR
jgi:hypothetical protein